MTKLYICTRFWKYLRTNIFDFKKRRVLERQRKSRWKEKTTITYQKVKTQCSLSKKAVQTTDNDDRILNFIICTAYILHVLQ